jgi:hypothetical protein
MGVGDVLQLGNVVLLWFDGWLFVAFMSLAFVSVSSTASTMIGIPLVFVLFNHLHRHRLHLAGRAWMQDWSMFVPGRPRRSA